MGIDKAQIRAEKMVREAWKQGKHVDTYNGVLCASCADFQAVEDPESFIGLIGSHIECYNCCDAGKHCLCHEGD